jgi:hypothetical protein
LRAERELSEASSSWWWCHWSGSMRCTWRKIVSARSFRVAVVEFLEKPGVLLDVDLQTCQLLCWCGLFCT